MFRINYVFFKHDENFHPIGMPIHKYVEGKTIKELNDTFNLIRDNHDLARYSNIIFENIEEIKEH